MSALYILMGVLVVFRLLHILDAPFFYFAPLFLHEDGGYKKQKHRGWV